MKIETDSMIPMTEANQNFSKVTRLVDQEGIAIILKNNKPKYVLVNFEEYEEINTIRQTRQKKIDEIANDVINENIEAFLELAK